MQKLIVYTAVFGFYDNLIEPKGTFYGCDFVCFTDNPSLKSDFWNVIFVDRGGMTAVEANRWYKMHPHLLFLSYEISLYVDANVRLLANPYDLGTASLVEGVIAVPRHPERHCIYAEAAHCVAVGKADLGVATLQMERYRQEGYPENNGLYEMNIIFRKHLDSRIIGVMDCWWREFSQGAKRDQLSFCYALWVKGVSPERLPVDSRSVRDKYFFVECHAGASLYLKLRRRLKRGASYLHGFFRERAWL